ncbi:type II toxin-antitoxin system RelE/ParE family toxin [Ruminococcaceae bacterium OttesenSCG-928-A16]|nr:type II toxin-antitoxin system RelE/ParE family toxin [Ruminococcaceae bacterium OttesenSCG-928-A16]
MKSYHVLFSSKARKMFKKLDKPVQQLVDGWLRKNLEGCTNPRAHGKALTGNHQNEWRYRVGDYRILVNIQDENILILVLEIGHRKEIY